MPDPSYAMDKSYLEKMFNYLIPNHRVRARILNQILLGRGVETFEQRNFKELVAVEEAVDDDAGKYSTVSEKQLNVDGEHQPGCELE